MANVLKGEKKQQIIALGRLGWSQTGSLAAMRSSSSLRVSICNCKPFHSCRFSSAREVNIGRDSRTNGVLWCRAVNNRINAAVAVVGRRWEPKIFASQRSVIAFKLAEE